MTEDPILLFPFRNDLRDLSRRIPGDNNNAQSLAPNVLTGTIPPFNCPNICTFQINISEYPRIERTNNHQPLRYHVTYIRPYC
jgi:hypothetical protein